VENNQFDGNIWSNPKLPVQYVQPSSGMSVDKQWKPMCSSAVPLRMPPGLALPTSSQLQHPVSHLQMSRQPGSVQLAVPSNDAGWLKHSELTEELAGAGRCHAMVASGNQQNIGGRDSVIPNDQYQQQQALVMAQVQATLHALQSRPQQSVSTDEHSQHAAVVGQVPAVSQRPSEQSRFGIACGKPDEPQVVIDAQQSVFVNGKNVRVMPGTAAPNATTNSGNASLHLQQSRDIAQQGQVLDLSKCRISTTPSGETGVTMQPLSMPQQAFMRTLCNEPFSNQTGPSTSRRLLPACFQDSGRPFVRSAAAAAVPLNVTIDKMQSLEQNQLFVHGPPNLRCSQSAWNANSPCQSPYSQYFVPSDTSADQYNMVGRLTPVMVGPGGDMFCSSIPSQVCSGPMPVIVGSKFPR